MIRNFGKLSYGFGHTIKGLYTTAVTTPTGLKVTYPHQKDAVMVIESPLETFISTIAACETAILRAQARRKGFKLGTITWTRIESTYDLSHMMSGGGPDNLIGEVFLDGEIETNLFQKDLDDMKETVEKLCPVYQMVTGCGIKVNSNWKIKHLDDLV